MIRKGNGQIKILTKYLISSRSRVDAEHVPKIDATTSFQIKKKKINAKT